MQKAKNAGGRILKNIEMMLIKKLIYLFLMSIAIVGAPTHAQCEQSKGGPAGLSWNKKITDNFLEIPGFRYHYGDPVWGLMVYTGSAGEDEVELQVYFSSRYITKAFIIFGPGGINSQNCLSKYKQVVAELNRKYGHFKFVRETKDPDKEDLFYTSQCRPYAVGLQETKAHWETSEFEITALLWGDLGEVYIEVEYLKKSRKKLKARKLKKIL